MGKNTYQIKINTIMKYVKKYENYQSHEDDIDFIIVKIMEHFPYEETKLKIESDDDMDHNTMLIDMINWFENEFSRNISDEVLVMNRLKDEYDFLNNE